MLNYSKKIVLLVTVLLFVSGCGEKVPVKEMSLAKAEISRAMSVDAKRYAPQEIAEAEKSLLESHEFVKNNELEKSKKSAVTAREKALEAYNKSIPILAKDTLEIAKLSLDQSEDVYAEALAEKEYNQAKDTYTEAAGLYEDKEYYACYEKSLEADVAAKEAKNVALGKKDILSQSISEVKNTLAEAENYDSTHYAAEKVRVANDALAVAEDALANLQLKKGFEAVKEAGANADEAYLLSIKGTAESRIDNADHLYMDAQNSEGAQAAKDELGGAKEALDQSKASFEGSEYKEAISQAEESAKLSGVVLGVMKNSAKEKIAGAELVYSQARESDGAAVAVNELNGAKETLDSSKSLYEESRYRESMDAAAESERLSNIVIGTRGKVAKGGDKGEIEGSSGTAEDYYTYKVRYIPERRDCLWRIAEKYYSNPFLWKKIYKANTDKIYNPDLIWPDMLLKVPKLADEKKKDSEPEAVKESEASRESGGIIEQGAGDDGDTAASEVVEEEASSQAETVEAAQEKTEELTGDEEKAMDADAAPAQEDESAEKANEAVPAPEIKNESAPEVEKDSTAEIETNESQEPEKIQEGSPSQDDESMPAESPDEEQ